MFNAFFFMKKKINFKVFLMLFPTFSLLLNWVLLEIPKIIGILIFVMCFKKKKMHEISNGLK